MRNIVLSALLLATGIFAQSTTRVTIMHPDRTGPPHATRRALGTHKTPASAPRTPPILLLELAGQGTVATASASGSMHARGVQNADYGVQNADYSATPTGSAQPSENTGPAVAGRDTHVADEQRLARMGRRYVQNADYSAAPDASAAGAAPSASAAPQEHDINARAMRDGSDEDEDCEGDEDD